MLSFELSFSFFIGYAPQSLFFLKPVSFGSCLGKSNSGNCLGNCLGSSKSCGSLLLKLRSLFLRLCGFPLFDLFLSQQ
jgi:hypothetical protein